MVGTGPCNVTRDRTGMAHSYFIVQAILRSAYQGNQATFRGVIWSRLLSVTGYDWDARWGRRARYPKCASSSGQWFLNRYDAAFLVFDETCVGVVLEILFKRVAVLGDGTRRLLRGLRRWLREHRIVLCGQLLGLPPRSRRNRCQTFVEDPA